MDITNISEPNISLEHKKKILKVALSALQPNTTNLLHIVEKTAIDINVSNDVVYEAISFYLQLLRHYLESSSDKIFFDKLSKLQLASDISQNILENEEIRQKYQTICSGNINMRLLKWRIDISLLNSILTRKVMPNVVFSITLSNGKVYNIEMDMKAFHELRLSVVLILKRINALKSTSLLSKSM